MPTVLDLAATPLLLGLLSALSLRDLSERRLPDRLTLPLAGLGLALAAVRTRGVPLPEIAGLVGGVAAFWAFGTGFHLLRGVEGLGLGDAKLLGAAGAWLGWTALPWLVLIAAMGALAVAWARGTGRGEAVAFGPWLAAAFAALWTAWLVPGVMADVAAGGARWF